MSALPSFTVIGSLFDLLGNINAGEIVGSGLGAGTPAKVKFTPNVPANYFVKWDGDLYHLNTVVATVGSDGSLTRNGDPVQLLANDAGLNIDGLQWRVDAGTTKTFWFDAPPDGGSVDLGTVAPVPNLSVAGVSPTAGAWGGLTGVPTPLAIGGNTPGGYPILDGGGKIGVSQLPTSVMDYKGAWNASTNSPSLADGTGNTGDFYRVSTAGTRNLGSGSTAFSVGDDILYNGSTWEKVSAVGAVASVAGLTGVVSTAGLKSATDTPPVFVVSTKYGGTLGGSNDTTCIQNTLDACHAAGGGIVVLPPNAGGTMWKAEQLIMRDGVLFKSSGWHSYALDGYTGGTKLQQLTGVNDDFIIIPGTGTVESDKFAIACGITDISLRGAAGSTAGHAIDFRRVTDDAGIGPQDLTTLERIYGIGFAGSVIHTTNAVPFSTNSITGVGNGGYVIEVEETADPTVGLANQIVLLNTSGDANMGYDDSGESGATIGLIGIQNQYSPAVTILGVKSEYRSQAESGFGGAVLGNFNAVLIDSCNCPISITGVNHLGHHPTKKCGDAIRIIGDVRPDLAWQSVNVKTFAGQVDGDAPFAVHDEPQDRGISVPHGYWGDAGIAVDKILAANGKVAEFEARESAVNSLRFSARASTGPAFIEAVGADTDVHLALASQGAGRFIWFQNSGSMEWLIDGNATDIGCNVLTKNAGRLLENGHTVGSWVSVPSTATSTGKVGQMAADSSWLYICTATNTWRRVAIASW